MAQESSTQVVPSTNSIAITPGLKWENVTLSISLGRGKKAVKKQLLEVCLISLEVYHNI